MAIANRIKFGKVSIVVFLTALIWVWADLALDERMDLSGVVITVAKSGDPALWVSFVAGEDTPALLTSVTLDTVVLKGPASRKTRVESLANKGLLDLDLFVVPEREGMTEVGLRTLNVLDFLKQSDKIKQLGLTVESCEPRTLTVQVRQLVKTAVPVECITIDSSLEKNLQPSMVDAYIPKDEPLKAIIRLTLDDENQAKNAPIEKTPYVELAPGQRREISTPVKIALTPAQRVLDAGSVPATLGFCFSTNLQGKYKVVFDQDRTEWATVLIKATRLASDAYRNAPFQLLLYIDDRDILNREEFVTRDLVFSFPEEYVRRNEIEADQPAYKARFKLVPIGEPGGEPPPATSLPE